MFLGGFGVSGRTYPRHRVRLNDERDPCFDPLGLHVVVELDPLHGPDAVIDDVDGGRGFGPRVGRTTPFGTKPAHGEHGHR